jgi:hypothetical protein
MGTKSREVIWGNQIMGAKALGAPREAAQKAAREADRAEANARRWAVQMEGYGGPAQPSPTIEQCINGGLGWLQLECNLGPSGPAKMGINWLDVRHLKHRAATRTCHEGCERAMKDANVP